MQADHFCSAFADVVFVMAAVTADVTRRFESSLVTLLTSTAFVYTQNMNK